MGKCGIKNVMPIVLIRISKRCHRVMQDSLCHYSNESLGTYLYARSSFVFKNIVANVLDTSI